mgnify:FL=1
MKKFLLFVAAIAISIQTISQDVVTYFNGQSKIYSEGETASLYSVKLTSNYTFVTIELSPTEDRIRMNYFTSGFTHIKVGPYYKIRFLGALSNDGNSYHPCEPDDGWGWSKCKVGEKYRYTLVFDGRIPHGYTNFTMVDDYVPYHGYSFRNYTINNPDVVEKTGHNEYSVKQHATDYNDGIVGIYEMINEQQGYKLGCIRYGENYKLIYLEGNSNFVWWNRGDLKGTLYPTSTPGLYKATWYSLNKDINDDTYVAFDGTAMKVLIGEAESNFLKTYPTYSDITSMQASAWSGSGIEIEKGYIVTNHHVVDGANNIVVQRVVNDKEERFAAEVVAMDKVNDLAIIKITDVKYYKFHQLPYSVKFSTSDVGESCYALGYPMISTMGTEIKLTTGVISSRSGFQGDVSTYQVSVPVQPGNSGGPLFNNKGELIGIINAKHKDAENASYAIKTAYVKNLVESFTNDNLFTTSNLIANKNLPTQVKLIKPFVYMIQCTNH